MSITQLVRDPQFVAELRKVYPARPITPTGPLRVPRQGASPSTIGVAFDYLFRVMIARRVGMKEPHVQWAVDAAPDMIALEGDVNSELFERGLVLKSACQFAIREAKHQAKRFHRGGAVIDKLLWSFYVMAHYEPLVRMGSSQRFNADPLQLLSLQWKPDADIVSELRALLELVDFDGHKVTQNLVLAPSLPAGKVLGGGEPDLVMDGWICDLKVVTDMRDAVRWADQLIMYCTLAALGGIDGTQSDAWLSSQKRDHKAALNGAAVYFARHGQWVPLEMSELFAPGQMRAVAALILRLE